MPIWATAAPDLWQGATAVQDLMPTLRLPSLAVFAAAAIGAAGLMGAAPPTAACRDAKSALKAGVGGLVLSLALVALSLVETTRLSLGSGYAATSPVAVSLSGAAALAASLALAAIGVQGAARAFGVRLDRASRPLLGLASVRLARMRSGQAAIVAGCALVDGARAIDPSIELIAAMALTLAIAAPIGALAAIRRVGPLAASAATLATLGVALALLDPPAFHATAPELLLFALAAAAAGFVVGSIVSFVAPRARPAPSPRPFDPFSGPSG